jgi:hypothetical protein
MSENSYASRTLGPRLNSTAVRLQQIDSDSCDRLAVMPWSRLTTATVVKLVVASLCVGLILAYFDTDPLELLGWARGRFTAMIGDWVQWSIKYIFIGAVIVVPIWLISYLWRAARGKS